MEISSDILVTYIFLNNINLNKILNIFPAVLQRIVLFIFIKYYNLKQPSLY